MIKNLSVIFFTLFSHELLISKFEIVKILNLFARKQWCDNWIKPQYIELDPLDQVSGLRTRGAL